MPSIRNRLTYANVASTLCLTLVLGGGVAFAAGIPPNSVGSIQIKNGNVKTPDLKNNAVKSSKIKDGQVTSADVLDEGLTADDLGPNSVGQSEIATDGVAATEIQDNSIDAGEIVNNSLFSADLGASSVRGSELGTITQRSAVSAVIAAGGNGSVTASCLAGEKLISGGNDGFFDVFVVASRQSGNGWAVFGFNNSGGNRTITAHAYCLQTS